MNKKFSLFIFSAVFGLSALAFADQEIPVPGELDSYGKIRVEGQRFAGLKAELGFCGTQEVAFEGVERGQCTERVYQIDLNDTYRLMAGTYTLRMGTLVYPEPIVIVKDEKRVIKMTKVKIPDIDGIVDFKMHYDVRGDEAVASHGAALWSFRSMKDFEKQRKIWDKLETANPEIFVEGSPAALQKALVTASSYAEQRDAFAASVNADGAQARFQASYSTHSYRITDITFDGFTMEPFYVTSGTDGQSLYLFPGTYRVLFTKDGVSQETGGIVVKEDGDVSMQLSF